MSEKMKLYWPVALPKSLPDRTDRGDLIEATLLDYCAQVVGPDTSVTIGWTDRSPSQIWQIYLGTINDSFLVADILDAEKDGHDACVIAPHWDPGLYAARSATSMPIVGGGEAAMMVAMTLGGRFGYLTPVEGNVPVIERNIRTYGFESRAVSRRPVRKFDMTYPALAEALEGDGDAFLSALEKRSRELIADGADVIIAGGQFFGPVFTRHDFWSIPNTGVPIVEVAACGMTMAEALVKIRRKTGMRKSEHVNAPFRSPPEGYLAKALTDFGIRKG